MGEVNRWKCTPLTGSTALLAPDHRSVTTRRAEASFKTDERQEKKSFQHIGEDAFQFGFFCKPSGLLHSENRRNSKLGLG